MSSRMKSKHGSGFITSKKAFVISRLKSAETISTSCVFANTRLNHRINVTFAGYILTTYLTGKKSISSWSKKEKYAEPTAKTVKRLEVHGSPHPSLSLGPMTQGHVRFLRLIKSIHSRCLMPFYTLNAPVRNNPHTPHGVIGAKLKYDDICESAEGSSIRITIDFVFQMEPTY